MDSKTERKTFIIKDIPFNFLANNVFQEKALLRKKKFNRKIRMVSDSLINGYYRNLSKDTSHLAAWDIFLRPRLVFDLQCPDCGHDFRIDFYRGEFDQENKTRCPKCLSVYQLAAGDVVSRLKAMLLEAQASVKNDDHQANRHLGKIIANAALLLEPVAPVFVVSIWSKHIGHYVLNTAVMLARLKKYLNGSEHLIISFQTPGSSNSYLIEQWARLMLIIPAAESAFDLIKTLSGAYGRSKLPKKMIGLYQDESRGRQHTLIKEDIQAPDRNWHSIDLGPADSFYWVGDYDDDVSSAAPIFNFTAEEKEKAEIWLAKHNMPLNYVTFMARDPAYYDRVLKDKNIQYHNYRNVDVDLYTQAMLWLSSQGIGSLRMGSSVNKKLDCDAPLVLDYASVDRSDFLDVYFFSNSLFTVTCGTGPDLIPKVMGKPVLLTNQPVISVNITTVNNQTTVLAFKPLWSSAKGRPLTAREIFQIRMEGALTDQAYAEAGLEPLCHKPEDILAQVREMYDRFVSKTWVVTDDEAKMQKKFADLVKEYYPFFTCWKGSLSYSYYKDHPEFLADA